MDYTTTEIRDVQDTLSGRWVMNRALFYNFWYYPNQELIFKDGCAVLRGHNGSGKSVTTQALITVLLDGDTSSRKLDPFGTKDRKISDTVLGEKDLLGIDKRTGYLALEFRKGNSKVTKTIGMGLEADRTKKKTKIWYFIINGKQVGDTDYQLNLYKKSRVDGKQVQIPLNEKELTIEIEQRYRCGKVYNDRKTYASMVNKGLFGFDSLTSYEGLMRLLIQARNPKLSDNSKPEAAASVLNDSLPQLTDEELRPLTSSIEAIDRLEKDLNSYKKDLKAIKGLSDVYQEYLELISAEKADGYLKAEKKYMATKKETKDKMNELSKNQENLGKSLNEQRKIKDDLENRRRERAELGLDEIESLQERKNQEKLNLEKFTKRFENAKAKEREAAAHFATYHKKYQEYESKQIAKEKELSDFMMELKNNASETDYKHHQRFAQHFQDNMTQEDYSFTAWEKSFKQYKEYVQKTKVSLEKWDHLKKQTVELENSMGLVRMKMDASLRNIGKLEDEREDEIQSIQEQQMAWAENSFQLDVPRDMIEDMAVNTDELFDSMSIEEYLEDLQKHVAALKEEIREHLMVQRIHIQEAEKTKIKHTVEMKKWQELKEIEPAFIQMKKEEWSQLSASGIPYQPFYEAFDFKEHVTTDEKIRIQSALYESGILASVVVAKEDVGVASAFTTVLKCQSPKSRNLSQVLMASENENFNEFLQGIGFSENQKEYVLTTGAINTNFIVGKSSIFDTNLYIGKSAREEFRSNKIYELNQLLAEQDKHIQGWNEQTENGMLKLKQLDQEYKRFPSVSSLSDVLTDIEREKRKINDIYEVDIQEKTKSMATIQVQMDSIKRDIGSGEEESNLSLDLNVFETELKLMNDYGECLLDIQRTYKDVSVAGEQAATHLATANMQKEYEKEHRNEAREAEHEQIKSQSIVNSYNERLEKMGSLDILAQLELLSHQIEIELPAKYEQAIRKEEQYKTMISDAEEAIIQARDTNLPFEKTMTEAWELAFREQVLSRHMEIQAEEGSLQHKAQELVARFKGKLDTKRTHVEQVKKRLTRRFQEQHVELMSYELEFDTKASDYVPTFENTTEEQEVQLKMAAEQMSQIVFTMTLEDLRMSPMAVVDRLSEKINSLQRDANEKDLQLYEEILINTLGENIRKKIHYVERWEREMNKFMEHKDNIKFRLKWVPKKTEKEGELDTSKLVEALKKDSRWIKTEEIARHFRSKIKVAKRGNDRNKEVNLQEVMRDVLDYRQWFEFEIYYTKVNATEKRLTQGNYNNLSGGQRALAMITPVLAAIYAKYMDARNDAPRLFTLDEAFARMDDENTDVIFQYIQKMGFNYILNSQALWGCYESVPSLNIYELARPNNRPFVSINSYYWNGNKRTSIGNEEVDIVAREEEPVLV